MAQILIADDELDGREALSRFLVRSGHLIACASDGREALKQLLTNHHDMLLLDVRMPKLDGLGLLEVMRSYLRWTDMPVILVTGEATPEETRRARDLGVCHILHKGTYTLKDLALAVDDCLKLPPPD
jgi:CheY-like chemotaxis protein